MHAIQDPLIAGAPDAPQRNRGGEALRSIARIGGRLVATVAIAAAGVAGWFAVEEFAFPPVVGAVDLPADPNPWPKEFRKVVVPWESFTITYELDGEMTHTSSYDALAGRTRISYSGGRDRVVEIAGLDAWERLNGQSEWTVAPAGEVLTHVVLGVGRIAPVHLSELAPKAAEPFISATEVVSTSTARRFEVSVDVQSFRYEDPVAYSQWIETETLGTTADIPMTWVLDVGPDGYLVRWEGRSPVVETWTEYPPDLVFESPLAASTPPAGIPVDTVVPVDPGAPADTVAPAAPIEE